MASTDVFDLKSIVEESLTKLKEFENVYSYFIDLSEGVLTTRLTDSSLIEIATELLSRLFSGEKDED